MMIDDESRLDALFQSYRDACPDVEPSAGFMPGLWQQIESRSGFWFVFQRFARTGMSACAALCLLLLVLNFSSAIQNSRPTETYTDALLADHSAENTYYTEAIPVASADDPVARPQR